MNLLCDTEIFGCHLVGAKIDNVISCRTIAGLKGDN